MADEDRTDDGRWGDPDRDQPTQPWEQPSPTVPLDPWSPPATPPQDRPWPYSDPADTPYAPPSAAPPYGTPDPYGPPPRYGQPQPYGQPQQYGQPQPYTTPDSYGQPQQFGTPTQYSYGMPPYGSAPPPRSGGLAWVLGGVMAFLALVGLVGGGWYLASHRSSSAVSAQAPTPSPQDGGVAPSGATAPEESGAPSPQRSTSPTSPTAPPSRAAGAGAAEQAWLTSSNAYCRRTLDPAIKRLLPLVRTDMLTFFERFAAVTRQADQRLRQSPPASLAGDVTAMTGYWDEMASFYDKAAAALQAGDEEAAQQHLDDGQAANEKGNAIAERIGLPDCAEAGGIGVSPSPAPSGLTV